MPSPNPSPVPIIMEEIKNILKEIIEEDKEPFNQSNLSNID